MKRYLCIWLPNCPDRNEPPSSASTAPEKSPKKAASRAVSLQSVAGKIQQQICPLTAVETLDKKPWAQRLQREPTPHQPESLLCDITGVAHLFGGEAGLISAVDQWLSSMKISGSLAIADSVGAAWALAHYGKPDCKARPACDITLPPGESGSQARRSRVRPSHQREGDVYDASDDASKLDIRSTGANRAGATGALFSRIVPRGETRQAIEPLPVESLRIDQQTAATLWRLGVENVGQLLRLPRCGLAPRLGKALVGRMEQALGEVDEPIAVYRAPVQHTASQQLDYPTSDQRILSDRIERLVKEVRAGMATCQRGALRMTCRLDFSAHPPLTLTVGLFAPSVDANHLCGLIVHQLEATQLPLAVEKITLSVPLTGPLCSLQTALFDKHSNAANSFPEKHSGNEISRLIDSLSSRLGCDSVLRVEIKINPLPEKSFSVFPLAGNEQAGHRLTASRTSTIRSRQRLKSSSSLSATPDSSSYRSPSPLDAMRRPIALLSQPIPIAVSHNDHRFRFVVSSAALPQRIRIGKTVHSIIRFWGAERIETSWWNGPSIRREYYRIEIDSASWLWVFRSLASKTEGYRWMLHGRFN